MIAIGFIANIVYLIVHLYF